MGGLARARKLSALERKAIASMGGNATLEKYGKEAFVRLAHRKAGRDIEVAK